MANDKFVKLTDVLNFLESYKEKKDDFFISFQERLKNDKDNNEALAEELFKMLKTADSRGYELEQKGHYEEALYYYELALKCGLYYKEAKFAIDVSHKLAICHLVIARVNLKLEEFKKFEEDYFKFLNYSVKAIKELKEDIEISYLSIHLRELFVYSNNINLPLFKEIFEKTVVLFEETFKENYINKELYELLVVSVLFLEIIFKIKTDDKTLKLYTNLVDNLINKLNKTYLFDVIYHQMEMLKHSSFIPKEYRSKYRNYSNVLVGTTTGVTDSVKVFISSVFSDFQHERDLIQDIVLPEMKRFCLEEYNLSFEIIDLRWGIELDQYLSEEESMNKVLSVCGEMVEVAKPYFVLFLSDRYGTEVEPELLSYLYPSLNINRDISITEIEYLLRLEVEDQNDKILLFTKDKENINNPKVIDFINNVRKEIPEDNVYNYELVDLELAQSITESLKRLVHKEYKNRSKEERTNTDINNLARKMVGFENELKTFKDLLNNNNPIIAVLSESGGGKSTFLAKAYLETKKKKFHTFAYFVKSSLKDLTENDFIEFVRKSVESVLNIESEDNLSVNYNLTRLQELMEMLEEDKRIVFFIDDYDHLIFLTEPFSWKGTLFDQLTFVVTATSPRVVAKILMQGAIPVQLLDIKNDFDLFAARKFTDNFKTIRNSTLHSLFVKFNTFDIDFNPMYLNALINELIYISEDDYSKIYASTNKYNIDFGSAIANHHEALIVGFPNSLDSFLKSKIIEVIKENNNNIYLLALLAFKGNVGVTLKEINSLLEKNGIDYSFTSFLPVKYAFADLVDTTSFSFIKINNDSFIELIFKSLDKKWLTLAANYIVEEYKDKEITLTYLKALLYNKEYEKLTNLYYNRDFKTRALVLNAFYKYPIKENIGKEFILKIVTINKETLYLMRDLIVNELESDYSFFTSFKKSNAKAIVSRLKPLMDEYNDDIWNTYFIVSTYLTKEVTKEEFKNNFAEQYSFIMENLQDFNLNSVYTYEYLEAFLNKFPHEEEYLDELRFYLMDLVKVLENHETMLLNINLIKTKLLHLVYQYFYPGNDQYLKEFERLFEMQYKDEMNEDKVEYMFFMANEYFKVKDFKTSRAYYEKILRVLYDERILFPSKTNLIEILAATTNDLADYYLEFLLKIYKQEPKLFVEEKEDFDIIKEKTYFLLKRSCLTTQSKFNASQNTMNFTNDLISNLNYATYLLAFTENTEEGFQILTDKLISMIENVKNDRVSNTYFIFYLLYIQFFMEYKEKDFVNTLNALNLYMDELNKYDVTHDLVSLPYIFNFGEYMLSVFGLKKSPKYQELEETIKEFVETIEK